MNIEVFRGVHAATVNKSRNVTQCSRENRVR
jgi:hypothetical protein